MILDSGNRTKFKTGAVRDIQEGKGRCDLLPLYEVGVLVKSCLPVQLAQFMKSGAVIDIYTAVHIFIAELNINSCEAMLDLAKHYEDGCLKYGERNWEKGIPVERYIDSAVRHYLKWRAGKTDERHDRAVLWNLLCASWTVNNKPELNIKVGC